MGEQRQGPLMTVVTADEAGGVPIEEFEADLKRRLLAVALDGLNGLPTSSPWYATCAQIHAACSLPPRQLLRPATR